MTAVLEARGLHLSYGDTPALRGADLILAAGEQTALMGPSGSGKSTLLHALAGIVSADQGTVIAEGVALDTLSESRRSARRLERMGIVFQFGDLVPELTLLENVVLPLQMLGRRSRDARVTAQHMLDALGVGEVADRQAGSVSGGQSQRAAVARALVHQPPVVLADEPTGALDTVTSERVMDAMTSLTRDIGAALLVVTHDNLVAAHLDTHVAMSDGAVSSLLLGRAS